MSTPTERIETDALTVYEDGDLERRMVSFELARTLATELETAQARIVELESQVEHKDLLTGIAEASSRNMLTKLQQSESGAAALREALLDFNEFADTLKGVTVSGEIVASCIWDRVKRALSTDAGRSMVSRDVLVLARDALKEDALWCFDNEKPPVTLTADWRDGSGTLTAGPNNCKAFWDKRKEALKAANEALEESK